MNNRAVTTALGVLGAQSARDAYNYGKMFFQRKPMMKKSMTRFRDLPYTQRRKYGKKPYSAVKQLDHAIVRSEGRRHVITEDSVKDSRTLYAANLLNISRTGASHNLNTRDRDIINLVGFNIQASFRNVNSTSNALCNWAVLAIRSGSSVNANNFFRGDGSGDRGTDFGAARTPLENHMMTINSDDYIVIAKGSCKIGPSTNTNGLDSHIFTRWVPCRTNVRYDSVGAPHQNMFFVYWYDLDDRDRTSVAQVGQLDMQYRLETVFHNVP